MAGDDSGSLLDTHRGPDPSILTSAALAREVTQLDRLLSTRIDAVEKAALTANENLVRVPTEVQKQVGALKEVVGEQITALAALTDERFASVARDADRREKGVADLFTERDKSVQVALQAAEKAVGKQNEASDRAIQKAEDATTKSLDSLQAIFRSEFGGVHTELDGLRDLVNALGNRVQGIEAGGLGATGQRTEARAESAQRLQVSAFNMMVIAVAVSALVSLAVHFLP